MFVQQHGVTRHGGRSWFFVRSSSSSFFFFFFHLLTSHALILELVFLAKRSKHHFLPHSVTSIRTNNGVIIITVVMASR